MSWREQIFAWDEATFRAIHLGWHSRGADLFFEFFSWLGLGHVQVVRVTRPRGQRRVGLES
jgi:hypothetical protein